MRSIAWLFIGFFFIALIGDSTRALADDDLHIIKSGKGRGAKAANTGNSSRGTKEFGFFAEPNLGFSYGTFSGPADTSTSTLTSSTLSGPTFAGLLGAVYTSYFAALRVEYALLGQSTSDFSLGIEVGLTLGSSPIRFYGVLCFIDNLNSGPTFSSNSYVAGISYYFTKKLVANLEYHYHDFGRMTQGGVSLQPAFSNAALTISLPLMFGIPSMPDMAHAASDNDLKEVGASMGEWNI